MRGILVCKVSGDGAALCGNSQTDGSVGAVINHLCSNVVHLDAYGMVVIFKLRIAQHFFHGISAGRDAVKLRAPVIGGAERNGGTVRDALGACFFHHTADVFRSAVAGKCLGDYQIAGQSLVFIVFHKVAACVSADACAGKGGRAKNGGYAQDARARIACRRDFGQCIYMAGGNVAERYLAISEACAALGPAGAQTAGAVRLAVRQGKGCP